MSTNSKQDGNAVTTHSLPDGDYRATCRERNALSAAANGHRPVFPHALMRVEDGWATFYRDDAAIWSCSARYAAANFTIEPA
ncbi:hypothetical protein [Burkholderia sp. Ac-20379]|uniref:hypothetical protein n=1 Tax=Burkholderia sp. Ac-20379 TaxID=2703900 RepID=UPI00197FCD6E|nr:hypothetical protein [Burkholderia sp. Ac-20379]MBN3726979.1 hypothetical protein [Burkholderia sp. Ac-20379]